MAADFTARNQLAATGTDSGRSGELVKLFLIVVAVLRS